MRRYCIESLIPYLICIECDWRGSHHGMVESGLHTYSHALNMIVMNRKLL